MKTSSFRYFSTPYHQRPLQYIYLLWTLLLVLITGFRLWSLWHDLPYAQGYEFEVVARSLASGQGYIFPAEDRWLFAWPNEPVLYPSGPTAWVEPLYTLLMAFCFKLFGNSGRIFLILLQLLFLVLTSLVTLVVAHKSFNIWTGLFSSMLLLLIPAVPYTTLRSLGNSTLAGLLVVCSGGLILWTLDQLSLRRVLLLGFFLGFATLTHSALVMFVPIAMIFILMSGHLERRVRWKAMLALPACAVAVLSPWILRNLLVFDQFVPLRNGFGFNAYLGNPVLVETYTPGFQACPAEAGPAFHASSPWNALQLALEKPNQRFLYARAKECIHQTAPEGYASMNEAQRDRVFLDRTLAFVLSNPLQFIQVTFFKTLLFFGGQPSQLAITLLSLAGVVLSFKKRPARVISLLVLAFSTAYILALPFFYRYRYPVEPLMVILASWTVVLLVRLGLRRLLLRSGHL